MPDMDPDREAVLEAWSTQGRGWEQYPRTVALEPPRIAYPQHLLGQKSHEDDAYQAPWLLRVGRWLFGERQERDHQEHLELPEPASAEESSYHEFELTCPRDLGDARAPFAEVLAALPGLRAPLSLELLTSERTVSTRIAVPQEAAGRFESQVRARLPEVVITPARTTLGDTWWQVDSQGLFVLEFGLSRHFALPLRRFKDAATTPLASLLAALSNLQAQEALLFQLLCQSTTQPWSEVAAHALEVPGAVTPGRDARGVLRLAEEKLSRPLYAVLVRIGCKADSEERALELARGVAGALNLFKREDGNELAPLLHDAHGSLQYESEMTRRLTRRSGMLLSIEELVNLWHPPGGSIACDKLARAMHRTRAAPRMSTQDGLLLGFNEHAGSSAEVRIPTETRTRHMHLIGDG